MVINVKVVTDFDSQSILRSDRGNISQSEINLCICEAAASDRQNRVRYCPMHISERIESESGICS